MTMDNSNWRVGIITDIIETLDAEKYEVARFHLLDAIHALQSVKAAPQPQSLEKIMPISSKWIH